MSLSKKEQIEKLLEDILPLEDATLEEIAQNIESNSTCVVVDFEDEFKKPTYYFNKGKIVLLFASVGGKESFDTPRYSRISIPDFVKSLSEYADHGSPYDGTNFIREAKRLIKCLESEIESWP